MRERGGSTRGCLEALDPSFLLVWCLGVNSGIRGLSVWVSDMFGWSCCVGSFSFGERTAIAASASCSHLLLSTRCGCKRGFFSQARSACSPRIFCHQKSGAEPGLGVGPGAPRVPLCASDEVRRSEALRGLRSRKISTGFAMTGGGGASPIQLADWLPESAGILISCL